MSFSFSRNNTNNRINRKTVNFTNTPKITNNSISLQNTSTVNLDVLTLNGTTITASGAQLNAVNTTPGTAAASKALVLDSSRNITNINSITCDSLTVNGSNVNGIVQANTSGTSKSNSPYLTNLTSGLAEESKVLTINSNKNISKINELGTNELNLGTNTKINTTIEYETNSTVITFNNKFEQITTNSTLRITNMVYASSLGLYVGIDNTNANSQIVTSSDGITWTYRTTPSESNWSSLTWSSSLGLFIAVANSGTGNRIMTSNNGINWSTSGVNYVKPKVSNTSISASPARMILLENGTIMVWGLNSFGQAGTTTTVGTTIGISTPEIIQGITNAIQIQSGEDHTLVLLSDGTVRTFGRNNYGQLGVNTNLGTNTPNSIPITVPEINNAIAISSSNASSCLALLSDGTIKAWGYNGNGQLGDGTSIQRVTPVFVRTSDIDSTPLSNVIAISMGRNHALALLSNGTVKAWGINNVGQLGDGTTTTRTSPITVPGINNAIAIMASSSSGSYGNSYAVLSDGTIKSWGGNDYGQLGIGTTNTTANSTPVTVSGINNAISIHATVGMINGAIIALLSDGTLKSWGYNGNGQLGDGTTATRTSPVTVSGINNAIGVAAGINTAAAILLDGTIRIWGSGYTSTPAALSGITNAKVLTEVLAPSITATNNNLPISTIAAGVSNSFAILNSGSIKAWGANFGQLANGNTTHQNAPVDVLNITNAVAISSGQSFTLALLSDGTIRSWGSGGNGRLGDGTTVDKSTPVSVVGITNGIYVSAGWDHALALLSDGTIKSWGWNGNGRLGDGTTTLSSTPVSVIGINNAINVDAGVGISLALLADGTVKAWGENISTIPILVPGINNAISISAGYGYYLILLADGTIKAWGRNTDGQLGDGTITSTTGNTLVTVSGINNAKAISAGYSSMALLADGTIKAWGINDKGQLGDGTTTRRLTPVTVSGISNAIGISSSYERHSMALLSDGTIKAWGNNIYGQIGINSTFPQINTPDSVVNSSSDSSPLSNIKKTITFNTISTAHPSQNNWQSITWSPERSLFTTVGSSGSGNRVLTSLNGLDWIIRSSSNDSPWNNIIWNGYYFIASTNDSTYSGIKAMRSTDGISWTNDTTSIALPTSNVVSVNFGSSIFDLYFTITSSTIITINYRINTISGSTVTFGSWFTLTMNLTLTNTNYPYLTYINNIGFVALSPNTTDILISPAGLIWTKYTLPFSSNWDGIVQGSTGNVLIHSLTNSPNHLLKFSLTSSSQTNSYIPRQFIKNLFLDNNNTTTVGFGALNTTTDGATFATTGPLIWNPKLKLFLTHSYISKDGKTWSQAFGLPTTFLSICYSPELDLYVAGLSTASATTTPQNIAISKDCLNWTYVNTPSQITSSSTNHCRWGVITWSSTHKLFIAASTHGASYTNWGFICSADGINWVGSNSNANTNTTNLKQFMIIGNTISIGGLTSTNGISWAGSYNTTVDAAYSPELNRTVTVTTASQINGAAQFSITTFSNVIWISKLRMFIVSYTAGGIIYSFNGLTWYQRASSATTIPLGKFAWSDELEILVYGPNLCYIDLSKLYKINLSNIDNNSLINYKVKNIRNWYNETSPANSWESVVYSGDLCRFVAVSNIGGNNSIMTSDNGCYWNTISDTYKIPNYKECAKSLAIGFDHILILMSNGIIKSWGRNFKGELGNGLIQPYSELTSTPTTIPNLNNVYGIFAGNRSSFAILNDGTVKAWGWNEFGQLGINSTINTGLPTTIPELNNVIKIASTIDSDFSSNYFSSHTIFLLNDGTIKTCGQNDFGQLGQNPVSTLIPTTVSGISNVIDIASGNQYTLVLLSDGTIKAWGRNNYGQLGDGTTINRTAPITVSGINNAIAIMAGGGSSFALLNDGTVKAWGNNLRGQLGTSVNQSTTNPNPIPTTIANVQNIAQISMRPDAFIIYGILNDGSVINIGMIKTLNEKLTNVVAITGSTDFSQGTNINVVLFADGTVKTWGSNKFGLLGNGIISNMSTDVLTTVIGGTNVKVVLNDNNIINNYPNNNWTSVCWSSELELFIVVASSGTGNRVITSPDGLTWISRVSAADNNWSAVCWSADLNLFAAVANSGTGNRVMTSTDGITWISRSSASDNDWTSICWSSELGIFVAVANSGTGDRVMTSPDGITWTSRTSASDNNWTSVCWSSELVLFVAVASSGTGNRIMTSPDGILWTSRNSPADNDWSSITWADTISLFVAVAKSGTNRVMTSTNGINWKVLTSNPSNNNWESICWASDLGSFLAISSNSNNNSSVMMSNILVAGSKNTVPRIYPNILNFYNTSNTDYMTINNASSTNSNEITVTRNTNNKALRLTYDHSSSTFTDIYPLNNNINFELNGSNPILNINGNLSLGGTILSATANDLNKTSVTAGIGSANKVLIADSNRNIANINNLSASTVLINNNMILSETDNNNSYLTEITPGAASASKILVLDSSKNISGINTLSTSDITINNHTIKNSTYSINEINKKLYPVNSKNFPNNLDFRSVCWAPELGLFVACGVGDFASTTVKSFHHINTSTDGINWEAQYTNNNNTLTSVCWSPDLSLFVAVASSGTENRVLTSTDGKYWVNRSSATDGAWNSICWGGPANAKLFVVVGTSNILITSPNGRTWTPRSAVSNNTWTSVTWASGLNLFVAVSSTGTTTDRVITSSDGISWTTRTPATGNNWTSVCWGGEAGSELLVAVSNTGTGNRVMTSTNGTSWTSRTSAADNNWTSVCWASGLGLFIAVADSGTNNRIMTSPNGITWTLRDTTSKNTGLKTITYSPQLNIVVALGFENSSYKNIRGLTSTNAINWNLLPTSYTLNWDKFLWVEQLGKFYGINKADSSFGYRVVSTSDCINWSLIADNAQFTKFRQNTIYDFIWVNELSLFIAVGDDIITTSPDGIVWTERTIPYANGIHLRAVVYSSSLNLCLAIARWTGANLGIDNKLLKSTDGITWSIVNQPNNSQDWRNLIWSPQLNIFCAVGWAGEVMTSTDGNNWTIVSNTIIDVNYVQWISQLSLFIAIPYSPFNWKRISISSDGINWNTISLEFNIIQRVTWINELNILCGIAAYTNGDARYGSTYLVYSFNAINWFSAAIPNANWYTGISYSPTIKKAIVYTGFIGGAGETGSAPFASLLTYDFNQFVSTNKLSTNLSIINDLYKVKNSTKNSALSNWYLYKSANANGIAVNTICYSPRLNRFVAMGTVSTNTFFLTSSGQVSSSAATSLTSWTSSSAVAGTFNSVSWIDDLNCFVAVGNNLIHTSNDGVTWASATSPVNKNWVSAAWSPELYTLVVLSNTDTIAYTSAKSGNTIQWYTTTVTNATWASITWSSALGLFVAVGNSGSIMTSLDGYRWTNRTAPVNNNWSSICWSPELNLFVAISNTGTGDRAMTSPDGITWTSRATPIDNNWKSISWAPELSSLVAVASSGTNDRIMTSYDGINWNASGVNIDVASTYNIGILTKDTLDTGIHATGFTNGHSLIVLENGSVRSSGLNQYGQLGNGTTAPDSSTYMISFVSVTGINNATAVAVGAYHSLALLADGTIKAWGVNQYGQLGNGTYTSSNVPVTVSGINNAIAIAAGAFTSYALLSDGTVKSWGDNTNGELGNGTTNQSNTPVTILGISNAISISTGYNLTDVDRAFTRGSRYYTILLADGTVRQGGYLAIYTNYTSYVIINSTSPINKNITNIVEISSGIYHTLARSSNGTLYGWGINTQWQLGSSGISYVPSGNYWLGTGLVDPGQITIITSAILNNRTIIAIKAHSEFSYVLLSDGSILNWGGIQGVRYTTDISASGYYSSASGGAAISLDGIPIITLLSSGKTYLNDSIPIIKRNTTSAGTDYTNNWQSVCWANNYNSLVGINNSSSSIEVISSKPVLPSNETTIQTHPSGIYIDQKTDNVGLGTTTPTFQLQLSTDSAAKPATSTWTVASDERLKENIEIADLDICFDNVKKLDLKRYKWKDTIFTEEQVSDRHKLGWIAQEVEQIFPKAVDTIANFGLDDCKHLNSDQIIAIMYGCTKKLINIYENQKNKVKELKTNIDEMQNFLNTLG